MTSPRSNLPPGAYKFTVKSAAEAVTLIREKLGPSARVMAANVMTEIAEPPTTPIACTVASALMRRPRC